MSETANGGDGVPAPPPTTDELRRYYAEERARIDASARAPVLHFFGWAVFWLVVASLFGLFASLKMHWPWLETRAGWLTFGRVRPVHLNLIAYGWGSGAGIGILLWLFARLARAELVAPRLLVAAAWVWNLAVAAGTVAILAGYSTSVEWLEFPVTVAPFLVLALGTVSICAFATFRMRRERHVYVTLWYMIGGAFWLPWLYTVVQMLIFVVPAAGVVQASTNWWFGHNFLGLWLTPIGVGAAYYIIPKVIGRPIYSYYLSIIGFWALALFYSWAGIHHLIGGPVPAWLVTVSVVGSMMMFIPVIAVAVNHHMTMVGYFRHLRYSPSLRFVVFGAIAYTAVSFQGSIESLRDFSRVAHFTHYTVGHAHLGVYGFYSMIVFGCMYYIVPRLTGWEWASATLIRVHFWTTAAGITLYFAALEVGGWFQGLAMLDPSVPFIEVVRGTIPYLVLRSLGGALMTVGHFVFAALFVMNLRRAGERREGPTMFAVRREPEEEEAPAR